MASAVLLSLFWTGMANVCTGQAPVNDNFTNAIELVGNSVIFSGTLTNATFEPAEPTTACLVSSYYLSPDGSVWWRWVATDSTAVVVDNFAYPQGLCCAELTVVTGTGVTALTNIACMWIDHVTNRYLSFSAEAGRTYYLRAMGRGLELFTLRLRATNSPLILSAPKDQNVPVGSSAMFGVVAGGVAPLNFQWQFKGNDLPGETFPTLILHHITATNAGDYSVVVSNSSGVTTSTAANLIITNVLRLDTAPSTNANTFEFHISGVPGRMYIIEQSTNLVDWIQTGFAQDEGMASTWAIPQTSVIQFVRVRFPMDGEICIAQLEQITFAQRLWLIEKQKERFQYVGALDVAPYMKNLPICPSGGTTFEDSYIQNGGDDQPLCKKVPYLHFIDPSFPP